MSSYYLPIRALHMIAGSSWLGAVILINFVLIPVLPKLKENIRRDVFIHLFPALFKLASILSATVVITGVIMIQYQTDGAWDLWNRGRWGTSIFWGGLLGVLLTFFHFFIESYLGKKIKKKAANNTESFTDIHLKIKIIPRIGLLVILLAFLFMIRASHGL